MTTNLAFSIYSEYGELMAKTKYAEDAASVVAFLGEGSTIKVGKQSVWFEGDEEFPASDSYDGVAAIITKRLKCR